MQDSPPEWIHSGEHVTGSGSLRRSVLGAAARAGRQCAGVKGFGSLAGTSALEREFVAAGDVSLVSKSLAGVAQRPIAPRQDLMVSRQAGGSGGLRLSIQVGDQLRWQLQAMRERLEVGAFSGLIRLYRET